MIVSSEEIQIVNDCIFNEFPVYIDLWVAGTHTHNTVMTAGHHHDR